MFAKVQDRLLIQVMLIILATNIESAVNVTEKNGLTVNIVMAQAKQHLIEFLLAK
jgi:hypothetical protein